MRRIECSGQGCNLRRSGGVVRRRRGGNFEFKAQYDFAGGAPEFKDVYLASDVDIIGPEWRRASSAPT